MLDQLIEQTKLVAATKVSNIPNYVARLMLARELISAHKYDERDAWKIASMIKVNVSKQVLEDPEFDKLIMNIAKIITNFKKQILMDTHLHGHSFDEVFFEFVKHLEFYGN
jgi:hypothetical protein